jgi:hypothetical protein
VIDIFAEKLDDPVTDTLIEANGLIDIEGDGDVEEEILAEFDAEREASGDRDESDEAVCDELDVAEREFNLSVAEIDALFVIIDVEEEEPDIVGTSLVPTVIVNCLVTIGERDKRPVREAVPDALVVPVPELDADGEFIDDRVICPTDAVTDSVEAVVIVLLCVLYGVVVSTIVAVKIADKLFKGDLECEGEGDDDNEIKALIENKDVNVAIRDDDELPDTDDDPVVVVVTRSDMLSRGEFETELVTDFENVAVTVGV